MCALFLTINKFVLSDWEIDCHENCMSVKMCLFGYKCIYNIVIYYDWLLMPLRECYPSYSS